MKKTRLVYSIVTQSRCRNFFLIGSNATPQNCSRDDEKFAKARATRSETMCSSDNSLLEFIGAREDFRWNHDKSSPYRSEAKEIVETAAGRRSKVSLFFRISQVFVKGCGEHRWNASVICETKKAHWQRESHRMKEDLELHLMIQ